MDRKEVSVALSELIACARTFQAKLASETKHDPPVYNRFLGLCETHLDTKLKFDVDVLVYDILALAVMIPPCRLMFCRWGNPAAMPSYVIDMQLAFHAFFFCTTANGEQSPSLAHNYALTPPELAFRVRMMYIER